MQDAGCPKLPATECKPRFNASEAPFRSRELACRLTSLPDFGSNSWVTGPARPSLAVLPFSIYSTMAVADWFLESGSTVAALAFDRPAGCAMPHS